MMFVAVLDQSPLDGVLRYVDTEHSFTFDVGSPAEALARAGSSGVTSVSVGTLQIEVGVQTGMVLYVWGLHPRTSWKATKLSAPISVAGGVKVDVGEPLQRGASVQIAPVGVMTTLYDAETGWVRIGSTPTGTSDQMILVATGIVLGLSEGRLDGLWLQPVMD